MALGWEDIRAEVLRRIEARHWAPGTLIPTEEALAEELGCARTTVNRALRDLAAAGLLERRRKAGTRVALHPVRRARFDIPVTRLEIEGRGQSYAFHLIEERRAEPPPAVASLFRSLPGVPLLRLRGLHLADNRPAIYEERWLDPAVLPEPAPDFRRISPNEWLVSHVPWTGGDIVFSAANASPEEADILGCAPGAALFLCERVTEAEGRPITSVRLLHAPGYRLRADL
ncbi:UTRA domain-containing protein [Rhodobacter sphaeroides]|jgi:transcriptional regulator, GntR family|uniref:Histidine utilization repressor, gntR family n=1 Tax=Cereibacter sphaeroides (strain ATCC 17023 / DSM 158 / JCM 6121 / CCUG 31486 / LMG 2827 / NBRC 12203 / NCIMB 8253 / ATH 2.4.1.) TaxID=272943 RepID=Q3J292_CERS4|nr:GntR family transcriptional regulator [Cereibacter sphaeroides]ABA79092.1 Histidine utilization repressor, gntR family [Cereibacter sphaeroides 2.4.1]AMJ47411.1 GntR family transcriptional regulator [Cereibacter sphaeroides]ANS34124.1 GntR family transcriptional regulator [Cereibacter sphaeroides]ATN63168.1 GntR family transcriptional regulator [Cereibacter sphaeroides]AXC61301.1 UTRA domain-containing protein [Cereibacter sphaeroides 2.4.1]